MNKPLKIGIAGCGLMGSLLAFKLLQQGHAVSIYEEKMPCHPKQAAIVAAGMISPYSELPVMNQQVFQLGRRSLQLWPEYVKALNIESALKLKGTIALSLPQHQQTLTHFVKKILHQYPHSNIQTIEQFNGSYFFAEEGAIDTEMFMTTLIKTVKKLNGSIFENTKIIDVKNAKIFTDNQRFDFDYTLDCRGSGANSNFTDLRKVRGEIIQVFAPEVDIVHPLRIFGSRKITYIVPRNHGKYIIGASEIESDDDSEISVRTLSELLAVSYQVHPGFAEARLIKTSTACRPALNDNLPKIIFKNRTLAVNGLYRHGYLLAPALVENIIGVLFNGENASCN